MRTFPSAPGSGGDPVLKRAMSSECNALTFCFCVVGGGGWVSGDTMRRGHDSGRLTTSTTYNTHNTQHTTQPVEAERTASHPALRAALTRPRRSWGRFDSAISAVIVGDRPSANSRSNSSYQPIDRIAGRGGNSARRVTRNVIIIRHPLHPPSPPCVQKQRVKTNQSLGVDLIAVVPYAVVATRVPEGNVALLVARINLQRATVADTRVIGAGGEGGWKARRQSNKRKTTTHHTDTPPCQPNEKRR